jgi:hypothetical protein
MATTLHLFTIVTPVPAATADVVEGFTDAAMNYALTRKGALRGLQSGIAVFPCVVSENVDPAATVSAQEKQRQYFACMARPVVVDLLRGTIGCYRRNAALGRIYAGHLRPSSTFTSHPSPPVSTPDSTDCRNNVRTARAARTRPQCAAGLRVVSSCLAVSDDREAGAV